MNYFLLIALTFFLNCQNLLFMTKDNHSSRCNSARKASKEVNIILEKTSKIIKNKYNLEPSGIGVEMPDGIIESLILTFDTRNQLSKEELRELLVKCAEELNSQTKRNGKIEQFLKQPPFDVKNAEIIIFNYDKNGRSLSDPEISTARLAKGVLYYKTIDPETRYQYKNRYQETYKEALAIIQDQQD